MWIKQSGVIGTVALPPASPSRIALASVEAWIESLHEDDARALEDLLEAAMERFATEFDERALSYSAAEELFAEESVPPAVAQSVAAAELSPQGLNAEIDKVEFRWRLDIIAALSQMLAERT